MRSLSAGVVVDSSLAYLKAPLVRQDMALMRRLHAWRAPRWVRVWMLMASRCGDGYLWGLAGLAVLRYGGATRFAALDSAALASALGVACFMGLKRITKRSRPVTRVPHCWSGMRAPDEFSFPSGHTLTAFAVVTALIPFYPGMEGALLFCAASVAASRLVLGLHFLSDVIAGCALGTAMGYLSVAIVH